MANIQKGEIGEIFGQGGGAQVKFGTSIEWYEKLGLLREVIVIMSLSKNNYLILIE